MMDKLYINGILADMSSDSGVYLTYRSNIFGDITSIAGNNSNTISLPMTAKNRGLIECCNVIGSTSGFPYAPHVATLERDGIQIVKDATLVLMEVNENRIQVALTFGVTEEMKKFASDRKLNELQYKRDESAIWSRSNNGSERFPGAQYGSLRPGEENAAAHPVLSVDEILDRISHDSGITFDYGGRVMPWTKWVVPLLKREGKEEKSPITLEFDSQGMPQSEWGKFNVCVIMRRVFNPGSTQGGDLLEYVTDTTIRYVKDHNVHGKVKATITGELTVRISTNFLDGVETAPLYDANYLQLVVKQYNGLIYGEDMAVIYPSYVDSSIAFTQIAHYSIREDVEGEPTWFTLMLRGRNGDTNLNFRFDKDSYIVGNLAINGKISELAIGDGYPFNTNLPDMKQIEFMKNIMQMSGTFAFSTKPNVVRIVRYDDMIADKQRAEDWSDHMIGIDAKSIKFSNGKDAQKNNMLYKDGDGSEEMDSAYYIENTSLDIERDAVKLAFKSYKNAGTKAYIPLYSYDNDDELEYSSDNNAYVAVRNTETSAGGSVSVISRIGLEWSTLLDRNYKSYVEMLNKYKEVTCIMSLSPITLNNIDFSRPVYLRQFGAYFAIMEIKTKKNNIAEVKLIKID